MSEQLTPEERAKLMDKIKKCLALSKSPEPHEAAAAMRQAQKMMERLGVTEDDIDGIHIEEVLIKTREGAGNCSFLNHLATLIRDTFGVQWVGEQNPGSANRKNIRYFGQTGRVQLAEYTHRVVQRSVDAAWEVHLLSFPHHKGDGGKRQSFRLGWLAAIKSQVSAMEITERERNSLDRYGKRQFDLVTSPGRKIGVDNGTWGAGKRAADGFTLHRPMTQEQLKIGR